MPKMLLPMLAAVLFTMAGCNNAKSPDDVAKDADQQG